MLRLRQHSRRRRGAAIERWAAEAKRRSGRLLRRQLVARDYHEAITYSFVDAALWKP